MTALVMQAAMGVVESVNADHVNDWPIENGHGYLVCDGIEHIEETRAAVQEFATRITAEDWTYSQEQENQLSENVAQALCKMSPHHDGRAFCCSILLTFKSHFVTGFCGDCRIGGISSNILNWLTEDDVPFLKMYKQGNINLDFYLKSRHLLSCKLKVGENNSGRIKTSSGMLSDYEHLLLCSDGFWAEASWLEEATNGNFPQKVVAELKRLAYDGVDNYSAIVV